MTSGVKFFSYPDHSGYGLAALAYVRALHNAGVPVWWVPLVHRDGRQHAWRPDDGAAALPIACEAESDAGLQDVAALLAACGPKAYDTVLFQTVPEHWPDLAETGKRNVGYTVWETDALPPHWLPLLNLPDRVLVPCTMNRSLFAQAGVTRPVTVVPHIRRHALNAVGSADAAALRGQLGIPADHFLFYSINVWDPRKALGDLVAAFARTFSRDDKVSLVLKTSTAMHPSTLERELAPSIPERVRALQEEAAAETGRPGAPIAVLAVDDLDGRVIDTLHATGDCFVSLSHGEGWGMGAFEAATFGKPLLISPYGGPSDYLPEDYPGFIEYSMEPVSGWAASASFQPWQRWAQPDPADAKRKLRRMVARHAEYLEPAAQVAARIANRYAEPVVVRELIAALNG